MPMIRAALGQAFFAVTLLALSLGCSSSSDSGGEVDGGGDSTTDGVSEEGADGSCDAASKPACCCDGDLEEFPVCSASGSYVCPAGTRPYTAEQCIQPCGPCMLPCVDTGVDGG
jgi:hypothetical protein